MHSAEGLHIAVTSDHIEMALKLMDKPDYSAFAAGSPLESFLDYWVDCHSRRLERATSREAVVLAAGGAVWASSTVYLACRMATTGGVTPQMLHASAANADPRVRSLVVAEVAALERTLMLRGVAEPEARFASKLAAQLAFVVAAASERNGLGFHTTRGHPS
jgi:hypothetical protein